MAMNKLTALLIFCLTLLANSHSFAANSELFRWTDEQGNVKYADRPPEGIDAERVTISTGTRSKAKPAETEKSTAQPSLAPGTEMEVMAKKDPAICQQAKDNLTALEGARIRITETDGSKRYLTEDEKEGQRDNARKFIKIHC